MRPGSTAARTVEREPVERPRAHRGLGAAAVEQLALAFGVDHDRAEAGAEVAQQRPQHRRRLARPGRPDQQRMPPGLKPKRQPRDRALGVVTQGIPAAVDVAVTGCLRAYDRFNA